jgi:hypothetical protein
MSAIPGNERLDHSPYLKEKTTARTPKSQVKP